MSEETEKVPKEPAKLEIEKRIQYIIVNKSTIQNQSQIVDLSRKLLCIEYPGIVENVDNMIETLGGMNTIEMAVGNYNRRLELTFRPDDIFSKPCWGDKDYNMALLVKITVSQPKINHDEPSSSRKVEVDIENSTTYRYELVGITSMTFKFSRLCDFQYLPLVSTENTENQQTSCRHIYHDIIPRTLPDFTWLQAAESVSMPLFFPPPLFAKYNTSKENKLFYERYKYYEKVIPQVAERLKRDAQKKKPESNNVIGRTRAIRKLNSIFVNFNVKDVQIPMEPREQVLEALKKKGLERGTIEKITECFKHRPIWSKSALLHKSGIRDDNLKAILPAVAFFCHTGPWRVMWCRLGYDPRTDPNSRVYQTFDYRIRASDGLKVKVQAKRNYSSNLMHYKAGPTTTEKFTLKNTAALRNKPKESITESHYILKPNILPPARQMFYQYCDLCLPEIENMLSRLPKDNRDIKYHFKNGWLPSGFSEHCREIVNKHITRQVRGLFMEEKKQKDEKEKSSTDIASSSNVSEDLVMENIESPIVIDDDEEDTYIDQQDDADVILRDEEVRNEESSDSDDSMNLEAVEEINKIIGEINSPQAIQSDEEQKEDSDEEYDPELIKLYKKLIIPSSDTEQSSSKDKFIPNN